MDGHGLRLLYEIKSAMRGRAVRPTDETLDELREYIGGKNRMETGGDTRGTTTKKKASAKK